MLNLQIPQFLKIDINYYDITTSIISSSYNDVLKYKNIKNMEEKLINLERLKKNLKYTVIYPYYQWNQKKLKLDT